MMIKKYVFCLVLAVLFLNVGVAHAVFFADYAYQNIQHGRVNIVKKHILSGQNINNINKDGLSALCLAVKDKNYTVYRQLRELGAKPQHQCMRAVDTQLATRFENYYLSSKNNGLGTKEQSVSTQFVAKRETSVGSIDVGATVLGRDKQKSFYDEPTEVTCSENERLENGKCVPIQPTCSEGYIWNGEKCVPNVPACAAGEVWNGLECVIDTSCPEGERWNGEKCVLIVPTCSEGTVWNGSECVIDTSCPDGYSWNGLECISDIPVCGEGKVWNGSECVIDTSCPDGYSWDGESCVEASCATGQRWNGSECVAIVCPANTHLVGNLCVADGAVVVEDVNGEAIYGIKTTDEDVFNIYSSPNYPNEEASIVLKQKGDGDAFGVHGISDVFNSYAVGYDNDKVNPVEDVVGNISITSDGSGAAYGLYAKIADITQYKEAINATGVQGGTAYGNISILHRGGGSSYGVFGDVRAYNAYTIYSGNAYGNIKIDGDGDIYGISGYVAAVNAVSPFFGHKVVGNIDLYERGNGDVYGMMVSKDNIPGAGAGDGHTTSWFAFNAYSSGGGDDIEGNIDIRNYGNGNAYGMYGGRELYNAMAFGGVNAETGIPNGKAVGNINILNTGKGDTYGMYLPDADANGKITNNGKGGASSTINIVNTGSGNAVGMRGGQLTNIENSGDIVINQLGNGMATGIYAEKYASVQNGGKIEIIRQEYIDEKTRQVYKPTGESGEIYGVYAEDGTSVVNVSADRKEISEGKIHLIQMADKDVYGVYAKEDSFVTSATTHTGWENVEVPVLDEEGNEQKIKDEEGNEKTLTQWITRLSDSQASQKMNIVNKGNKDAYGIYSKGVVRSVMQSQDNDSKLGFSQLGNTSSEINIENHGNGNAYGIYSAGGTIFHEKGVNATSVINIANLGDGVAYGLYGEKGTVIENSGDININNLGSGMAVGIYGDEASTIRNSGKITISREAFVDENGVKHEPLTATGGTAYGIYAKNKATVINTGEIQISNAAVSKDILLEDGAVLANEGEISFVGENLGEERTPSVVNFSDFGGEVVLGKNGRFFADELAGALKVSQNAVMGSLENKYVLEGALQTDNVDTLDLYSKSALFGAGTEVNQTGGYDVVLSRKNFEDELGDENLGRFYEANYENGNGLAIYDELKTASTNKELREAVADFSGTDVLPNFRKENAWVHRYLSRQFNDSLFNRPNENYMGGYKYFDVSMKKDGTLTGSDAKAHAAYGMLKTKSNSGITYGLGATAVRLDSDYDNNDSRKSNIFGLWAPVGYDFRNDVRLYSKLYAGYADGEYKRMTNLGKYSADTKEYQYGVSNELRYNMNLGAGIKFEPLAELNLLGIYQKKINEGNKEGAIHADNNNSLSLEGGLGAYLSKEMIFNKDNKLGIQIGGVYYVEFLDPDEGADAKVEGLSGKYKLQNKSKDGYAVFSVRTNYTYKDIALYAVLEKETGRSKALTVDLGMQYKF